MKKQPIHSRYQSLGFTITELLTAIIILGILSSISISYFERSWKREKLKLSAKIIESLIETARITAFHSSQTCKLLINDSNVSIEPAASGNDCSSLTSVNVKTEVDFGSNVMICSRESFDETSDIFQCNATHSNPDGTQVTFTPRGTSVTNAFIKLSIPDYDQLRCVAVTSPLGLIRHGVDKGDGCNFKTAF